MGRPPRDLWAGQTYHLMSRGTNRRAIFLDDEDRQHFLMFLSTVARHRRWSCLSYCLMGNHIHLTITAPEGDVSDGMRDLLSRHARVFNRRHDRTGHLFQQRFRAVAVATDAQVLSLIRYIARNPVRAGLVDSAEEWPWSSHTAILRRRTPPGTIDIHRLLYLFDADLTTARERMRTFVDEGIDQPVAAM